VNTAVPRRTGDTPSSHAPEEANRQARCVALEKHHVCCTCGVPGGAESAAPSPHINIEPAPRRHRREELWMPLSHRCRSSTLNPHRAIADREHRRYRAFFFTMSCYCCSQGSHTPLS
jgi:hypothetical protein